MHSFRQADTLSRRCNHGSQYTLTNKLLSIKGGI